MDFRWLLVHILPSIGFILALALLSHILRERRPPTSTQAWLMAIIFIPYLGVPLYLIFGGRKMLDKIGTKPELAPNRVESVNHAHNRNAVLLEPDSGNSPPSANNQITFLPKGEQAFQTMVGLIHAARHSVYIATFKLGIDETGRAIVQALSRKASQGLKVCLLLDALVSVSISKKFLALLTVAGGQVAFFMPMIHLPFRGRANWRNHRKMLICDNRSAIIGGMNLASEYMGPQEVVGRWQDLSLLVRGPVTDQITGIFRSDWKFAIKASLDDPSTADQTTWV